MIKASSCPPRWASTFLLFSSWIPAFAGMTVFFIFPVFLNAAVEVKDAHIRISKGACQFVSRHVPDDDVAFKAGQGINGKKVLPADINASPINDMERLMRVRITNDAAKIFGLRVPEIKKGDETLPLARPEVEGFIFLKDGVPYLGDKPLENEQQRQLAVLCRQSQTEE